MPGFGVHTFKMINEAGKETYVKFHWKTQQVSAGRVRFSPTACGESCKLEHVLTLLSARLRSSGTSAVDVLPKQQHVTGRVSTLKLASPQPLQLVRHDCPQLFSICLSF